MGGRRPTPAAMKLVAGNPGRRPIRDDEPEPVAALEDMTPPGWLSKYAKEEWERSYVEAVRCGVLSVLDVPIYTCWCETVASWRRSCDFAAKGSNADYYPSKDGDLIQKAAAGVRTKDAKLLKQLAAELGFSPGSRAKVKRTDQSAGKKSEW